MNIKKTALHAIKKTAIKNVNQSVSQTCVWFCYQPKAPKNLKKISTK